MRAGRGITLAAALWLALSGPGLPCAFHTIAPERTAIDRITQAQDLILARPGARNPFAFEVTEVLRGTADTPPPFLVSSEDRRRLSLHPDEAVIFARGGSGEWERVALLDTAFRPLLEQARDWPAAYTDTRFATFAGLLDHPDPDIRRLALQEIDKAPYPMLRSLRGRTPPAETLIAGLWTRDGYPYQSIHVLLLGLEGSDAARAEILRHFDDAARPGDDPRLGAFATALVELDGAQGIARLEQLYFADPAQPLTRVEQVVEALAIQSAANPDQIAGPVGEAFDRLIAARPGAAAAIARQYAAREDWSQVERLGRAVSEGRMTASADLLSVAVYLARARAGAPPDKG